MTDIGLVNLALFLVIGLAAGWIASLIVRGRGLGLIGNLVVGVIGAYIGPFFLRFFNVSAGGLIGDLATATVGAMLLIFVIGVIKRI
ncbi:MAG: GlsB/YeaQ/YmgE family stress response membrane protein [Rhodospirillales bacterium]|jgi:uncharacterized membrane protein YeaQ/YmgE (transglycosylase-associated protein family)|nr:GlsB/YeaQ/YmgE family stress response membrane protein [Rhodospirillales bacterium]